VRTNEEAGHGKPAGKASTSRQFWELKAEQVLNKIFEQDSLTPKPSSSGTSTEFTDVEIIHFSAAQKPGDHLGKMDSKTNNPIGTKPWKVVSLAGMAAIALTALIQNTSQQNALEKAHNLQLLAQLRQHDSTDNAQYLKGSNQTTADSNYTPPSPPPEEWIQELAKLPESDGSHPGLLKVPLPGAVKSPPPIRTGNINPRTTENSGNSVPTLLGVIQGVGKSGSAIIQWEGISTSINSGETIGTSGWRLRETNGESIIIERAGQHKRISINSKS
jgi:hypothetical protein